VNIFDKGFFRLARNVSLNSDHRYKVGCVIVVHSRPVSVGWNVIKTHPTYTSEKHPSIHAEVKAVITSRCDITGGIAYVYRETRDGKPAIARPCDFCYSVLLEAGIKTVYYSSEKYPYWEKERIK
jgi:deoxycytidylate deaminase